MYVTFAQLAFVFSVGVLSVAFGLTLGSAVYQVARNRIRRGGR